MLILSCREIHKKKVQVTNDTISFIAVVENKFNEKESNHRISQFAGRLTIGGFFSHHADFSRTKNE